MSLPPRYEIRPLGEEHEEWARAICVHTNCFHSPLWSTVYPNNKTERLYAAFETAKYLITHQINSGHSLGVFDTEYVFKNPASIPTGGKLYWDTTDKCATEEQLASQMDFPLVSIAMAYDAIDPLDIAQIEPMIKVLPLFATVYEKLNTLDPRDETWKPSARGQVLMRNATNTVQKYAGQGLMKAAAEELMRRSAKLGFRAIQIESASPAVERVWSKPPEPFRASVVAQFRTEEVEQEQDGGVVNPFEPARINIARIFVEL
ncbi:hypothetical protein N7532_000427 [Penicillium argentinense]|uniref:Uncharacterized protein n=1 Tax=Penicillium argentinense TaxID=1131581 RepID=A0A9W9KNV0_9EURO|nr:uncharacterized protein N7532_000427 [Penicillium argentinense]KAJ5112382.1 hypothetical protein N7532_000427 [Penicillium argentinense]